MTTSQVAGIFSKNKNESSAILSDHDQVIVTKHQHSGDNHGVRAAANYFRIPKFIQAILTLIICAVILSTTLCVIVRIRQRFSKKKSNIHSAISETEKRNLSEAESGTPATNKSNPCTSSLNKHPIQSVKFERKISGPFGDDAIAFVRESYKKHTKIKTRGILGDEQPRPHST